MYEPYASKSNLTLNNQCKIVTHYPSFAGKFYRHLNLHIICRKTKQNEIYCENYLQEKMCLLKMDVLISAVFSTNRARMAISWKEFEGNLRFDAFVCCLDLREAVVFKL